MWLLALFLAAFFIGMNNILIKNCLRKEHTLPTMFGFSVVATIISLVFFRNIDFTPSLFAFTLIILKAAVLGTAWYLLLHSLRHMELSEHAPLRNLSSVFLVALSFLFLGERLSGLQYLGILIIILGAYILELHELHSFHNILAPFRLMNNKNIIQLFIALILISFSAIIDKYVLVNTAMTPNSVIFFSYLLLSFFFLTMIYIRGFISDLFVPFKKDFSLLFLIGAIAIIADTAYFFVVAIPAIPISLIIPIKRFSNLFAVIMGGKIFHEERILHKALSCVVMLVGMFVLFL